MFKNCSRSTQLQTYQFDVYILQAKKKSHRKAEGQIFKVMFVLQ